MGFDTKVAREEIPIGALEVTNWCDCICRGFVGAAQYAEKA
jgi:hypothetical protein